MKNFIVFFIFFLSCDSWMLISTLPSTPQKDAAVIKEQAVSLFFLSETSPPMKKETDYFFSLLALPKKIYVPSQDIPHSLSPKDLSHYQEIKRKEADILLCIKLAFEEKEEKTYGDSVWIYASAELRMEDTLEEKELWKAYFQTDKGVIAWKGKQEARRIALEELAKKAGTALHREMATLTLSPGKKMRLSASFDTEEQLCLFQNELMRLEKAKHFRMQQNLLVVSTFLGVTLESQQDLLSLKLLLEQACQSAGIPVQIFIGQKSILLQSKS